MSIPGMSCGMSAGAVGAGELPDMSIPGMSIGISAGLVGTGGLSDPTATGTAAVLTRVAADASSCEVSVNDPMTATAATVAPTDATRTRRHRRASHAGRLRLGGVLVAERGM